MELNRNIVGVQSVLVNCSKNTGDFTKINYVGGNERHILKITSELAHFLVGRRLLDGPPNKPSPSHIKELNEIAFFLALNTKFKRQLPMLEEYSHLTNIIPQLSKCVLANICIALNIVSSYGYVIESFPLEATEELLDQMIDCLRNGKLYDNLQNAFVILEATLNKVSRVPEAAKETEIAEDVLRIAGMILQNVTFITTEEIEYKNTQKIYQHMGFTLLRLLQLMLHVDPSNNLIQKFIPILVSTTCSIMKCITIDVYCSWVEINESDEDLQTVISGKAYSVLEKYQKNKMASELVSMLGAIARKPKTIAQRIMEADTATKIQMVDENDQHQKSWFRALCLTPVFSDAKAVACIENVFGDNHRTSFVLSKAVLLGHKWWQLCDQSTVDRLLSFLPPTDNHHRQLVLKCASNLCIDELSKVVVMHFNKKKHHWCEDVNEQLVVFFNQVHANMTPEELKQILLMFIQNPLTVLKQLYTNAFKRSVELIQVFQLFKDVSDLNNISQKLIMELFEENPPTSENIQKFIQLFASMMTGHYHTWDFIVSHVILVRLVLSKKQGQLEEFKCCLQILRHFEDLHCQLSKEVELFEYILICASENRCTSFLQFETTTQEITSHCVDYMLHKCTKLRTLEAKLESFPTIAKDCTDSWSDYYKSSFWETKDISLLNMLLPDLDLAKSGEGAVDQNFTSLFKTLPRCTSAEWKLLLGELTARFSAEITLTVLSDIMCLLCDFADNQSKLNSANNTPLQAIQFCLQNYGAFAAYAAKSVPYEVVNSICRVLRHIPEPLNPTEGMCLINILPEEPLQSLAEDEQFIKRIALIRDKQLSKALAQKVLASCQRNA